MPFASDGTGKDNRSADTIGRRAFVKLLGLWTMSLGFGVSIFPDIYRFAEAAPKNDEEEKHRLLTAGTVDFMGFRVKEITPNQEFYITTYSTKLPRATYDRHKLRVEGLVDRPRVLTMMDIEALKDTAEVVTLQCIGNPVGGDAIGTAFWEGVSLRRIMDDAGPKAGIVKVALFADDGYSDSIPYELARSGDIFLAHRMNGEPLPPQHGYPLRAIVPGIYGMKHVKWLSKIELVNYDFKGFWEKKGWSDEAVIQVKSQILMPMQGKSIPLGNYAIGGVAFGGRYGISRVQVSLDGGKTWTDANMKEPLSRWAWSLWQFDWKPGRTGRYTIRVRAFDRSGKQQESGPLLARLFSDSFPSGATGIHQIDVKVTG